MLNFQYSDHFMLTDTKNLWEIFFLQKNLT